MKRLLQLTLILAVAWATYAAYSLRSLQQASTASGENLQQTAELLARLEARAIQTPVASIEFQPNPNWSNEIEKAVMSSGIESSQIVRIEPQGRRRIGKSQYEEQPTYVEIQNVTMPAIGRFLASILTTDPSLNVRSIRIVAPRRENLDDSVERWVAELTLTHLIYSPKS